MACSNSGLLLNRKGGSRGLYIQQASALLHFKEGSESVWHAASQHPAAAERDAGKQWGSVSGLQQAVIRANTLLHQPNTAVLCLHLHIAGLVYAAHKSGKNSYAVSAAQPHSAQSQPAVAREERGSPPTVAPRQLNTSVILQGCITRRLSNLSRLWSLAQGLLQRVHTGTTVRDSAVPDMIFYVLLIVTHRPLCACAVAALPSGVSWLQSSPTASACSSSFCLSLVSPMTVHCTQQAANIAAHLNPPARDAQLAPEPRPSVGDGCRFDYLLLGIVTSGGDLA
jgi:hypothetical protein